MKQLIVGLVLTLLVAGCLGSDSRPEGGMPAEGQAPPEEAITACSGMTEGASCSFSGMNGETVSGTCQTIENQLSCVPDGQPRP